MDEKLNYYQCLQLLEKCVKEKVIIGDPAPERASNILIYRNKGTKQPEGWYSENIFTVASELVDDEDGQKIILAALSEMGIEFSCERMPTSTSPNPYRKGQNIYE